MIYWILAALSLVGVVLNIKKIRWCFVVWAGTNFAWMVVDIREGSVARGMLMGVYFLLALWGLWEWRRKR
tara:strand:+ start:577 stop:786 length:210 start_codon:yes stop_codon:yes gene_type:complete